MFYRAGSEACTLGAAKPHKWMGGKCWDVSFFFETMIYLHLGLSYKFPSLYGGKLNHYFSEIMEGKRDWRLQKDLRYTWLWGCRYPSLINSFCAFLAYSKLSLSSLSLYMTGRFHPVISNLEGWEHCLEATRCHVVFHSLFSFTSSRLLNAWVGLNSNSIISIPSCHAVMVVINQKWKEKRRLAWTEI